MTAPAAPGAARRFFDSDLWFGFRTSPVAVGASLVAFVMIAGALLAPWVAPHQPFDLASLSLMDSLLLANVYVELLGERQATLGLGGAGAAEDAVQLRAAPARARPRPLQPRIDADVERAHREFVATLGPNAAWLQFAEA